ncbi:MAG: PKD domain-containing protein [Candidatus Thermoplasmatota archaeon]|nr:PKD domain-containing protein [Candidatus Thermoplasmatota archaeon]
MEDRKTTSFLTKITLLTLSMLLISAIPLFSLEGDSATIEVERQVKSFGDLDFDGLEEIGYRPRFAYPGAEFIQTPEPMPEDAVHYPVGSAPLSRSAPTRATWDTYYEDDILIVHVDVSSGGGGQLSSNEEQLLDRIISDFVNFSFPRVKDHYDPLGRVTDVVFYVHQIDGSSGIGGYYQPGTDEFHVDRADLSWAGVITAHEFQHYVHRQYDPYENLWVDEGCADYAAYIVYGLSSAVAGHAAAYLENRPYYGLVISDSTFQQDGTTGYYGISLMFQLYMGHQYGGRNWTRALVRQTQRGTYGVTKALSVLGTGKDFQDVFADWMVATRFNDGNLGDGQFEYGEKTYPYGSLNMKIAKTHSGTPVTANREIRGHSITVLRFSSPQSGWDDFRMKFSFSSGEPYVAMYRERPGNTDVEFLHSGSGHIEYDFTGWGSNYTYFQLIISSTSSTTVDYSVDILDLEAPVSTISVSPRLPDGVDNWYTTPPKIIIESSESTGDSYYQLNGGPRTVYGAPFYLTDGMSNISYWSKDRHNNEEVRNFIDIKVDTSFPTSSLEVDPDLPEAQWYSSTPSVSLQTSHPDSIVEYKFNNDEYVPYNGSFTPPEGQSVLYFRAVDQAGNTEMYQTKTFLVDTMPPSLFYTLYPSEPDGENGWYTSDPLLTLTSPDAEMIYYAFGSNDLMQYLEPINIPEGESRIRFVCVDQAGNLGNETRFEFKVDSYEPVIEGVFDGFSYTPQNSSNWLNFPPILEIIPSEDEMVINYSINGAPAVDYEMRFELPEGENEIRVNGKDRAGNEAPPLFFLVKVDKRTPYVEHTFTHATNDGWFTSYIASVELLTPEEDNRSSIAKVFYRWGAEDENIYKGTLKIPEGINTLTYWAEDLAGNEMEARMVQMKKDSTLPMMYLSIAGLDDGVIDQGDNITIDISGSSDESGIIAYSFDFYGTGSNWGVESIVEHIFTEPGTYIVIVEVKDRAGNIVNESFTVEVLEVEKVTVDDVGNSSNGKLIALLAIGGIIILLLIVAAILLVVVKGRRDAAALQVPLHPQLHGQVQHGVMPPARKHAAVVGPPPRQELPSPPRSPDLPGH